jgi:protein disulfide-isomerase
MTTRVFPCLIPVLVASGLVLGAASVSAQEIQWRHDYSQARKEAQEKGRPLFIDVSTENCMWCRQLELRTFRDPSIASLLNERFIPLAMDAEHDYRWVEPLKVQNYPTLIFAAPDGKILGYQEGFIEVAPLRERLQRALDHTTAKDWMARDLQEATRAVEASDYIRAVTLLKNILEDGKDRPAQVQARVLLQVLEKQAAVRCAQAREMAEKGQVTRAVETATEVVRNYAGTKAAYEGGKLIVTLASRVEPHESHPNIAHELLSQAQEEQRHQHYLACLEHCEAILAHYPDQPEAAEAEKVRAEIKNNPESALLVCDQMSERLSQMYLSLADTWLKKGQPQQAVFYLERIIHTFPSSRQAELAQIRIAQIQGQPPRTVDFKK